MSIYRELILDHYQRPRHKGALADATHKTELLNPLCGDKITIYLRVADDRIVATQFEGSGCAISQASASMLTERLQGVAVELLEKMTKNDILEMLGIELSPNRLKCALLSLETAQKALASES
jgi:nitrogen fixation NifU-like protein